MAYSLVLSSRLPRSAFFGLNPISRVAPSYRITLPYVQQRGKKKNARASATISVKLRQDLASYGRKGSIVPVPIGQMRNYLYPGRMADYVTMAESKQLKRAKVTIEKDITFGRPIDPIRTEAEEEGQSSDLTAVRSETPRLDLNVLSPQSAFNLLSDTIPPTLDFYRTPITPAAASRSRGEPLNTKDEEALVATPPPEVSPRQVAENIYGSVSTADIGAAIKALIHENNLSMTALAYALQRMVILPDEDIEFVNVANTGQTANRVKKLGEFQYAIRIKSHREAIRRIVRVLSSDISDTSVHGPPTTGPHSFTSVDPPPPEQSPMDDLHR